MGVRIEMTYSGELRCEALHTPSRSTLTTDAPVDNQGRGEAFSPTDLVATALGTCVLTTMAIFGRRHEVDLTGATASVEKVMITAPTRRIVSLACEVTVPLSPEHPLREALERAGHTCPVHQSLHPDVQAPITFRWTGAA